MQIDQARKLRYGQRVYCPADAFSSTPAFIGTVRQEGLDAVPVNVSEVLGKRTEYIWVVVERSGRHKSTWPSNRLGTV